jgi:hypothetical protein
MIRRREISDQPKRKVNLLTLIDRYMNDMRMLEPNDHRDRRTRNHKIVEGYKYVNMLSDIQCTVDRVWLPYNTWIPKMGVIQLYLEPSGNGMQVCPYESLEPFKKYIKNFEFHNMQKTEQLNFVYIPITWSWRKPDLQFTGHSTLLVVNLLERTYNLFDPNGGYKGVYNGTMPDQTMVVNIYRLLAEASCVKADIFEGRYIAQHHRQQVGIPLQMAMERHTWNDEEPPQQVVSCDQHWAYV